MNGVNPSVPVERQPLFVVRPGRGPNADMISGGDRFHQWFQHHNGCWCSWCDRLVVRLDGRWRYRGRHRRVTKTA